MHAVGRLGAKRPGALFPLSALFLCRFLFSGRGCLLFRATCFFCALFRAGSLLLLRVLSRDLLEFHLLEVPEKGLGFHLLEVLGDVLGTPFFYNYNDIVLNRKTIQTHTHGTSI